MDIISNDLALKNMKKNTTINLSLQQTLQIDQQAFELNDILNLFNLIQREKNLRIATAELGYSYRKAWNLIKHLEQQLEQSLVFMERGRGTCLTTRGKKLLTILQDNQYALNMALTQQAQIANHLLQTQLSESQILKIMASDNVKLCHLREQMSLSLEIVGSMKALKAYAQGECVIAGFHLPVGELGFEMLLRYQAYLNHDDYCFVLIDYREQGLISAKELPVYSLKQAVVEKLRFVNRQLDSGTRDLLDLLLKQTGLDARSLKGYQHEEHTHLAVASLIAAKEADVGLGIRTAAERLHLHFEPLAVEYYFLLLSKSQLLVPEIYSLLTKLQNRLSLEVLNYSQLQEYIKQKTD